MVRIISRALFMLVLAAALVLIYLFMQGTFDEEADISVDSYRYGYQQLSAADQKIYRKILGALSEHKESIRLTYATYDAAVRIVSDVVYDYPEYFWATTGGTTHTTILYGIPISYSYSFNYTMDSGKHKEVQPAVNSAASQILSGIDDSMSEYDKVKTVYEALIRKTQYNESLSEDQTIYNVLVNGEGVCSGYAKTMQYLLNRLGIFCTYVTGEVPGFGNHAWNLVRIDGEYYYLDATWGDPLFLNSDVEPFAEVNYDYFLITTKDILTTHKIVSNWSFPECTATRDNYYVRNSLFFDAYDREVISAMIRDGLVEGRDEVSFRFTNHEAYEDALGSLFEGKDLSAILQEEGALPQNGSWSVRLSYMKNDDLFTVTIDLSHFSNP